MPSLKEIRRRIASVKNTQKITRAQKLVSVAKFARATQAVTAARPYGRAFDAMVSKLAAEAGEEFDSPLLAERPEQKILIAVMSTDRGFCGSLNANLFKIVTPFVNEKRKAGIKVDVMPWGKRARQYAVRLAHTPQGAREAVLDKPKYEKAAELAAEVMALFEAGTYDHVYVAFVEFKSAMSQVPSVQQLLPIAKAVEDEQKTGPQQMLLVEPSVKEILPGLLKRAVAGKIFRAMLEGAASEHGARMTAMDAATNNASEVLRLKKIEYNRARQAAITKEIIEITSGAQAV